MSEEQKEDKIELQEDRAMVYLPTDAVEITVQAKIYKGGDRLTVVEKVMNMQDIREAFKKANDGYIDDEDTFVITDRGREYLESVSDIF